MKLAILTSSRADWGIFSDLANAIQKDSSINLSIIATGMHLNSTQGNTLEEIRSTFSGRILQTESFLTLNTEKADVSRGIGQATIAMANLLEKENDFDLILLLGDRFELIGACLAIVPFNIPIAHFCGGEISEGAIDDKFRHAITKLADYHFVSHESYQKRVLQLGASPDRVFLSGLIALEKIKDLNYSMGDFNKRFNLDLNKPTVLITYQPATFETEEADYQIDEFIKALEQIDQQLLITLGNADTKGQVFNQRLEDFCKKHSEKAKCYKSLGVTNYFCAMKYCSFLLGNSSSGIAEAASFNKIAINVGNRQRGRARSENVIDCGVTKDEILHAVKKAGLVEGKDFKNIFYRPNSYEFIINSLKESYPFSNQLGFNNI